MKRVSLDTPNEVLWTADYGREIARIMQELPIPVNNTRVTTPNGNSIQPRTR